MKDSSYSKEGSFPTFITQTNEKKVTIDYILSAIEEKYSLRDYKKFVFTDIGAGEGTVTLPIMKFIKKGAKLDTYCIEPSSLIETLKKKCGSGVHYIKKGMEETDIPESDLILMAHSLQYVTNKEKFAKTLENSLNPKGKLLVVGASTDSDDLRLKRALALKLDSGKRKEDFFEYFKKLGLKVSYEYAKAQIDLTNALKLNEKGEGLISFYYHKPFSQITFEEVSRFQYLAKKFAPEGKLVKTLRFIWVEK
ncbi:MAG: methyltransferase domain-containing protein [Candidatus Nanoarchaeia archaeon]